MRRDHVLGIGGASVSLAHAVIRIPVGRALDLGTGCGIQALHLDAHCDAVVATDTNARALALAAATARLNDMSWDLRQGSMFEPVAGERFDLIVSNPPFVVGAGALDYQYRDSGMAGDALCRTLVEQAGDHLEPGGTAQIMANWIVRDGGGDGAWRDRVRGWLAGTGLHAGGAAGLADRSATSRCGPRMRGSCPRTRRAAAVSGWTGSVTRASPGSAWA